MDIKELPHGHGLSFKKGVSDGLLDEKIYESKLPNGHENSYKLGVRYGAELQEKVKQKVKK